MSHPSRKFRAAVVQTLAVLGDVHANIAIVRRYVREAVQQGAKLVALPECMNSGYLFDSAAHCRELSEPLDGAYCEALRALCREHDIFIASGFTELGEDGKSYNSALLFDPRGELICHYQKQFLATHDQNWFEVGVKGNPVVDTELGRIGLLICFDGRIPEIARCLAMQGAEVVVDLANFFTMDQAEAWVPARAYENGMWFVAATKAGVERSIYYPGGSMIVAPDGQVQARIPYDTHGVVSADITIGDGSREWQFGGDKIRDRRPGAYGILSESFETTPLHTLLNEPIVPEAHVSKVAAVQAHVAADRSLDEAIAAVEHAALLGVKVIALPLYFGCADWCLSAEGAAGQTLAADDVIGRLTAVCRRHGAVIVFSTVVKEDGLLIPQALLIGAQGVIGRQRQVHLGPREQSWARAGAEGFHVFDTSHGRIGILLGYDGMFPESSRALTLSGAEILVWCCAWEHPSQRALLTVPKAEDNRVYVVCANRADAPLAGGSFVIPPDGFPTWDVEQVAPVTRRWGAVMPRYANIALARQKSMIPGVDMVRNRLVETYSVLTATHGEEMVRSMP